MGKSVNDLLLNRPEWFSSFGVHFSLQLLPQGFQLSYNILIFGSYVIDFAGISEQVKKFHAGFCVGVFPPDTVVPDLVHVTETMTPMEFPTAKADRIEVTGSPVANGALQ